MVKKHRRTYSRTGTARMSPSGAIFYKNFGVPTRQVYTPSQRQTTFTRKYSTLSTADTERFNPPTRTTTSQSLQIVQPKPFKLTAQSAAYQKYYEALEDGRVPARLAIQPWQADSDL